MTDAGQVIVTGILIFYIIAVSGLMAEIYTEQGIPTSGVSIRDYSFSETSETSFNEVSALNQTNIKILSGKWELQSGVLKFIQNDYLLFIFPQWGKIAFTNLIGKNNQTIVSNTYTIQNPISNNYEVIILQGTDGGDKIKVLVDNTGFHLREWEGGNLIPLVSYTTNFPYSNPSGVSNATITTEYNSQSGIIAFTFNNQEIFRQSTHYSLTLIDQYLSEQKNYYGGLSSENINFSVSKIQYQTTVNNNQTIDPLQFASIMFSIITNFNLPGLTTDWYGILINVLAVKLPLILLILLVAIIVRDFFKV